MKSMIIFLKKALIINVPLSIISLLWWWLGGLHTIMRFANCFGIVGGIIILIGAFWGMGSIGGSRHMGQSQRVLGSANAVNTFRRDKEDQMKRFPEALYFCTAGAICVLIGIVVYFLFS